MASCVESADQEERTSLPPAGKTWKLTWRDEFDGDRLDAVRWEGPDHKRRDGWWSTKSVALEGNGDLAISTWKDGDRYLDACVFQAKLLNASQVGLPDAVNRGDKVLGAIPDDRAKRLQGIVWAAVKAVTLTSRQPQSAAYAVEHWPTPIVFSGWEVGTDGLSEEMLCAKSGMFRASRIRQCA